LDALDVELHFLVDFLAANRQSGLREVPLSASKQDTHNCQIAYRLVYVHIYIPEDPPPPVDAVCAQRTGGRTPGAGLSSRLTSKSRYHGYSQIPDTRAGNSSRAIFGLTSAVSILLIH
jgi:hypothetical protein